MLESLALEFKPYNVKKITLNDVIMNKEMAQLFNTNSITWMRIVNPKIDDIRMETLMNCYDFVGEFKELKYGEYQ